MTRPSISWRGITRVERAMPWAAAAVAPADEVGNRRAQRWAMLAAMIPPMSIALTQLIGHRTAFAGAWPTWRPVFLDLMIVIGGAVLVAAAAFGMVAWRRGRS